MDSTSATRGPTGCFSCFVVETVPAGPLHALDDYRVDTYIRVMSLIIHPAPERGHHFHGWLDTHHSFSFGQWHDPTKMGFGALRVLNDDIVTPGQGFGTHPHDNMEIVSIPLKGALHHHDSMGNDGVITEGEVQRMSAGTGLFHSEKNHSNTEPVNFLQIWIFPEKRDSAPSYDQKRFAAPGPGGRWQTLVSPEGEEGSVTIGQQAWIFRGDFSSGARIPLVSRRKGNGLYLFVLEAPEGVALGRHRLGRRDGAALSGETETATAQGSASLLLLDVPLSGF